MRTRLLAASALAGAAVVALAGSREQELRELREALGDQVAVGDWIYDDVDEAFTVAKRTGKPVFLVFR